MADNKKKSVGFKVVSALPETLVKGSFYWVKGTSEDSMYFAVSASKDDALRLDMDPKKLLTTVTTNGQGTLTFKDGAESEITTVDLTEDIKNVAQAAIGDLTKVMIFTGVYETGVYPTDAQIGDIILHKDGNEYIYVGSKDSDTDSDGNDGWVKFGDQNSIKKLLESVANINVKGDNTYVSVTETEGKSGEFTITLTNIAEDGTLTVDSELETTLANADKGKLARVVDVKDAIDQVKAKIDDVVSTNGVYTDDSDVIITISEKEAEGANKGKQKIDIKIAEFMTEEDSDNYDGDLVELNLKSDGLVKGSDIAKIITDIEDVTATALTDLDSRVESLETGFLKAADGVFTYNADAEVESEAITVLEGEEDKFATAKQVADLIEEVADDICEDMKNVVSENLTWENI